MTEWEAVQRRVSCRAYQDRPIDGAVYEKVTAFAAELERASGLRFVVYTSGTPGTPAVRLAPAMFAGIVPACAALIGGDDMLSAEKVGYYGESLVLYATGLGLGTCWVAGTYERSSVPVETAEGERLWDVIPLGYAMEKTPVKQKMLRAGIRSRDRALEEFAESEVPFPDLPQWFQRGVEAVRLGPSAVNQQPVNLVWKDGRVFARLWRKEGGLRYNDLGIAKRQFEAGAAACGVSGAWDFGNGGEFHLR